MLSILSCLYLLILSFSEDCFGKHSNVSYKIMDENVDQDCSACTRNDQTSDLWISEILKVSESSQWPKYGLFVGASSFLGHFDECITVNAFNITGQYCLVENTYQINGVSLVANVRPLDTPSDESSAWLALQMYQNDIHRFERNKPRWALCVPSSCSSSDLVKSLRRTLDSVLEKHSTRINITTNIVKDWCHTTETDLKTCPSYYLVKYFITLLLVMVILSSIQGITAKFMNYRKCSILLECFSIQKNYHKLTHVVPGRELMFIHWGKVLIYVEWIFVHRLVFIIQFVAHDATAIEQIVFYLNYIALCNFELADVMFFFSGVVMYQDFVRSKENSIMEIVIKITKRWTRLFSTYVVIRLFYAHVLPTMSNGPLWHEMRDETAYCKINLLEALLTLPIARNQEILCLQPSWQIPIDFQLFCISYACLSLCRRLKMDIIKILVFLIVLSVVLTFGNIFYKEYTALLFINLRVSIMERKHENREVFYSLYMSTAARLAAHVTGTFTAAMVHKLMRERFVLSKVQIISGFAVIFFTKMALAVLAFILYDQRTKNEYKPIWHAIYGAFFRVLGNIPIVFLFFIYHVTHSRFLEKLSPRIIVLLSRLSYSLSLSHFMVMLPSVLSQRTPTPRVTWYYLIHITAADIVFSYALAFVVYMLIEGPVQNLISLVSTTGRIPESRRFNDVDKIEEKKN